MAPEQISLFDEPAPPRPPAAAAPERPVPAGSPADSGAGLAGARFPGGAPAGAPVLSAEVAAAQEAARDPLAELRVGPFAHIENLEELAAIAAGCRRCGLRDGCKQVVFGEGNPRALVMLVGEGPGEVEDELGRPFVGKAGQLLDRILAAVGFRRQEVYITNVVKCRPPGNRVPTDAEMMTCLPYLYAQIRLIRPSVLVCLGSTALRALVSPHLRISQARGRWYTRWGIRIMPTYHPAALLRDPDKKWAVWEDFQQVRRAYEEALRTRRQAGP